MSQNKTHATSTGTLIARALTLSLGTLLVIAAFFSNALRSADFDPQQMRTYIERTIRFGGTFYENGLHNKGPLDPIIYRFAFTLGGYDAFWYAISGFIAIGTILIAYAAYKTSIEHDAPRSLGLALACIAFFHFALAKTHYSGVLYSRNEVSYILICAWIFVLAKRPWSSDKNSRRSAILLGILLGLAIQTVLTTVFAAAAIAFVWLSFISGRFSTPIFRSLILRLGASSIATFISAPLWYLARGKFDEFWGGWWIYARFQSDATSRSLGSQFGWGWDNITKYYGDWPLSFAIILMSLVMLWLFWQTMSHRQKTLYIGSIFWLIGGWIELILSQRYSTHYFVVIAVPTMLLASLLIGHLFQVVSRVRRIPLQRGLPILALCASLIYFPNNSVKAGLESFSNFQGIEHQTAKTQEAQNGDTRTLRAILDVVSADNDALLAWTGWPWTYLDVQRVSASRMIWSSMFLGEIYLAESGPQWVVPHTWEWFAQDMQQSKPSAYTERNDFPRQAGNPFDKYVNENMTLKFVGEQRRVWIRNDIAKRLSDVSVDTDTRPPLSRTFSLGTGKCKSYSFTIESSMLGPRMKIAMIEQSDDPTAHVTEIDSEYIRTISHGSVFNQSTVGQSRQPQAAQIIIGNRSALITIDGQIVSAHRLNINSSPELSIEILNQNLKLSPTQTSDITWPSGCSSS